LKKGRKMSEHTEKYDALIEKMGGLGTVAYHVPFGIPQIKDALAKGDEFLNTLPLATWDRAAGRCSCPNRHYWSAHTLCERVCILKRAAYRLATK
jgi:hypothetical protein